MARVACHMQFFRSGDDIVGAKSRCRATYRVVEAPSEKAGDGENASEIHGVVVARDFHPRLKIWFVGIAEKMWPTAAPSMSIARKFTECWEISEKRTHFGV